MNDGSITFSTSLDNRELEKQLLQTSRKIDALNQKVYQKQKERMPLIEQAKTLGAELDAAKAKIFEMQNAPKGSFSTEQIEEQSVRVRGMQSEWNKIINRVEGYDRTIQNTKVAIEVEREKAGELSRSLAAASDSSEKMDKATKKANKSMSNFAGRLKSVVRSALVFTVITQALAKFRNWLGKVIQSNSEASSAVAKLKAAMLTLAQPIVGVVIPAFTKLVGILTQVVAAVARVIAALFGTTYEQAKDAAEELNGETDAIKGVGGAAQKAEKQLASFDEINKLVSSTAASAEGPSELGPDFSGLNKVTLPSWLENLMSDLEIKIKDLRFSWDSGTILKDPDAWIVFLSGLLGAVIGVMFGGLSGGAIGLLLGATIGLIACTFLDKTNDPTKYKRLFTVVLAAILGAIIGAKFGGLTGAMIGLSLGLMVGIIAVEFQKGTFENWDSGDTWNTVLNAILFAVIGFAFGGVVGGVIGLALGATISIIEISFLKKLSDEEADKIKWRTIISAILGALLGVMFGAITLVGGPVGAVLGLIMGISISFLSLVFEDELSQEAKAAASKVFDAVMVVILSAVVGAMFGGLFGAIIGLSVGLAIGIASVTFDGNSKSYLEKFAELERGKGTSGGSSKLNINTRSIPTLAAGAVIPPNREFLAVLGDQRSGTNVEAPLSAIEQAVDNALRRRGFGGGGETTVVLEVDGQQFGKVVFDANNRESRRVGVRLVEV